MTQALAEAAGGIPYSSGGTSMRKHVYNRLVDMGAGAAA